MRVLAGKSAEERVRKLEQRASRLQNVQPQVQKIVADVRRNGDQALLKYARKWDGLQSGQPLRVEESEIRAAWDGATPELRSALDRAAVNIRRFCEWQKPTQWMKNTDGMSLGQLVRPLESVGCYVPGGRYPLPSTLLMTVIPAQVAGVREIGIVSPQPRKETLAAAALLGVAEFYRVGGAHAITALAYGTKSIRRVDKIVGPGNLFVTAAKKLVAFDCSIDFLAGPTEVMIVAEEGDAEFVAADLVAQAEHDPETLPVFITSRRDLAEKVMASAKRAAKNNPIACESLMVNGAALVANSHTQALDWANRIAPEHITVARSDLDSIRNAGSVFVGDYSPQAVGDYASGPNHVLPTAGAARYRGGLSVFDFVKIITVQELTPQSLLQIAPVVTTLAEAEGLEAHAQSVRVRCAHA
jgi:histidinol dehydrogenase